MREVGILTLLAIPCVVLGFYPAPVLDALHAPVARTMEIVGAGQSAGVAMNGAPEPPPTPEARP